MFINADGRVIASTLRSQPDGYMFIGQFHTLCNGVAANTTAIIPMQTGVTVNTSVTLCNYFKNQDLDFANFYTKNIDAVNDGTPYATATVLHSLQGFNTMDILPESVWCLNFHPKCKNWDGMVYCNDIDKAVDIYLQSGTGTDTRSEYGAVHTINRQWQNYASDMQTIGKTLISNVEFHQFSIGSNQQTTIQGARDWSIVGGHVDTSNRRMISFIGCEECCGYLYQENRIDFEISDTGSWHVSDGRGFFGCENDLNAIQDSGGTYAYMDPQYCGSRCSAVMYTHVGDASTGARGVCDVSIV